MRRRGPWERPGRRSTSAPAAWITSRVSPFSFSTGGGIGYSGVAEPYLNFGMPGVLIIFFGLGYFLMRQENSRRGSVYRTAVLACSYAALLWTVRNDFGNFARPVAWSILFVFAVYLLAERRRSRTTEPASTQRPGASAFF